MNIKVIFWWAITSIIFIIAMIGLFFCAVNADVDNIPDLDENAIQSINENFRRLDDAINNVSSVSVKNSIESDAGSLQLVNDEATPGNSKVYGTNGSGTKGWQSLSGGGLSYELFLSNGTFTTASNVSLVLVTMCGGGGGGGNGVDGDGGGGGGAGGSIIRTPVPVVADNSYTVTVGTGGAGGPATPAVSEDGDNGNSSSFAGVYTITCAGGGGGKGYATVVNEGIGGDSTATRNGATSLTAGSNIFPGGDGGRAAGDGAGGGASIFGRGGAGEGGVDSAGEDAPEFGGGGGGGEGPGGANYRKGGDGADGFVLIEW